MENATPKERTKEEILAAHAEAQQPLSLPVETYRALWPDIVKSDPTCHLQIDEAGGPRGTPERLDRESAKANVQLRLQKELRQAERLNKQELAQWRKDNPGRTVTGEQWVNWQNSEANRRRDQEALERHRYAHQARHDAEERQRKAALQQAEGQNEAAARAAVEAEVKRLEAMKEAQAAVKKPDEQPPGTWRRLFAALGLGRQEK